MKLWDLRSFRSPLASRRGLGNGSPHTSVIFDPFDGATIVTAASESRSLDQDGAESGAQQGRLVVLDSTDLEIVHTHPTPGASSPVRLHWSAMTDQLFTTFRDGSLRIFYSPSRSTKGITLALARAPRATSSLYTSLDNPSIDSYPVFEGNSTELSQGLSESAKRRCLAKERKDPVKTKLPQPPVDGVGKGGRIGVSATQHVVQNLYGGGGAEEEDPREALLKFNEGGEVEFTKAWKSTQPKPIYDQHAEEEK